MTDDDILAEMRLKGYSSDDPEVIELIDAGLSPGNTSVIIPVKMKKDGSYDAYSKVMPNSDFKLIGDYTDELINRMRSSIEAGKADINPVYRKNRDSCTYCPYIGICRFDGYVDGYTKRVLPEMKDVEVLEKIYKELMGKES